MKAMVCPQCSANLSLDDSREFGFCTYCGAKIQINETVIHKHSGEINFNGIATANSIAQKGFMDLAQSNFEKAGKIFEKAQEIEPTNTYVLLGLACSTLDPNRYFINQLVGKHATISEEEKAIINAGNAKFFLKIFLYYDLPSRFNYIVENHQISVDLDLLTECRVAERRSEREKVYLEGIINPNRKLDIIDLFLKHNVPVNDLASALAECAITGVENNAYPEFRFSTKIFSTETLDRLMALGLDPRTAEIHYYAKHRRKINKEDYEEYTRTDRSRMLSFFGYGNERKPYYDIIMKYLLPDKSTKKQGCYVATCVYGSYDCPQVWTLRRYRDNTLDKTPFGKAFIKIYYAVSPKIIKLFGETSWFKSFWKKRLDKMVYKLNGKGIENTPYNDLY